MCEDEGADILRLTRRRRWGRASMATTAREDMVAVVVAAVVVVVDDMRGGWEARKKYQMDMKSGAKQVPIK